MRIKKKKKKKKKNWYKDTWTSLGMDGFLTIIMCLQIKITLFSQIKCGLPIYSILYVASL